MSDSSQPMNPQWKLIEHKVRLLFSRKIYELQLKRKERKMQKVKSLHKKTPKKTSDVQIDHKKPTSKDLCELKEDVLKKKMLSSLNRESADDNSNSVSITAKELIENKPQGSADRLAKLNEYVELLAQSKTQLEKRQTETTKWATKYRKRVVDMQMDVREYEKKLYRMLNKKPSKLEALIALAELNCLKRQQIHSRLAKTILEHPEKTLARVVLELVFNILQSTLWTLAMIRDFFTRRQ